MADNEVVSGIIDKILAPILAVVKWLIELVFSNQIVLAIVFFLLINLIAIILMKKDKERAKKDEKRIRESTLMMVAIIGGSIGMHYAMHKFRHKTLHKKFSIGIPVIIVIQVIYISYLLISGILS